MKTRYLVFNEYDPKEMDAAMKMDRYIQAEYATHPEKYMKYVWSNMIMADLPKLAEQARFVNVYEADSPEQMMNNMAIWYAQTSEVKTMKRWIIPLQELTDDFIAETFQHRKLVEETKEQSKTT